MATVDWRNRFGSNWITTVRDQGRPQNCWAFATTALYEAMIRIEHSLWNWRSEGDLARGTGKQPWDLGNIGEAIYFVEHYGLADPDCFPWSTAAALYTSKPHGAAMQALPLSPTPDRSGRTMRIAVNSSTTLTDVAQKKQWIDLVGPMATMLQPPGDFGELRDGIYVPTVPGTGMAHALLVVGYDDDQQCWIVKNSWGPSWGVGGFGKVSYNSATTAGAGILQDVPFHGVRGTNPDPWTRRRMRNGALIQGGNGALRNNFELFVRVGVNLEHWYRENADPNRPWVPRPAWSGPTTSGATPSTTTPWTARPRSRAPSTGTMSWSTAPATAACATSTTTRRRAGGTTPPSSAPWTRWVSLVHPEQPGRPR